MSSEDSFNLKIPVSKKQALAGFTIAVYGAGMISGSAMGSQGAVFGLLIGGLGAVYIYVTSQDRKKRVQEAKPNA